MNTNKEIALILKQSLWPWTFSPVVHRSLPHPSRSDCISQLSTITINVFLHLPFGRGFLDYETLTASHMSEIALSVTNEPTQRVRPRPTWKPAGAEEPWRREGFTCEWSPWSGFRPEPAPLRPCKSGPTSPGRRSCSSSWPSRRPACIPSPCRGSGHLGMQKRAAE